MGDISTSDQDIININCNYKTIGWDPLVKCCRVNLVGGQSLSENRVN